MRAPTRRPLEEIAEEIVDNLRPLKTGRGKTRDTITAEVVHDLRILASTAPRLAKAINRAAMRRALAPLAEGLELVDKALPAARRVQESGLFDPRLPLIMVYGQPNPPPDRAEFFAKEIKRLRKRTTLLLEHKVGRHHSYDLVKDHAAVCAYRLMEKLSKHRIASSKDSPFRTIASRAYEAVTGIPDADLKRACDAVLARMRGTTPPKKS